MEPMRPGSQSTSSSVIIWLWVAKHVQLEFAGSFWCSHV
jgi:hypothetical protein